MSKMSRKERKANNASRNITQTATEVKEAVQKTAIEASEAVKKTAMEATEKIVETKQALNTDVYVQYANQEVKAKDVVEKVKAFYMEAGHKLTDIKKLDIYIKLEDNAAYYVINECDTGKIDL